jgi:tetratricopeptide (TPR) repeat protein
LSPTNTGQERIVELLEAGLALRAYRLAEDSHSLHTRNGASSMVLAGRMAMNLGGTRRGYALFLRASRADPQSPEARYYAASAVLDRQGAAVAWTRMKAWGEIGENAPVAIRADWLALKAVAASRFRAFGTAEMLLQRAERLDLGRPGTWVARAAVLAEQDRYGEALGAAREALRLRPWYPAAVRAGAHLLLVLGRGDEACDSLSKASAVVEDSRIVGQLAAVLAELRRFAECLDCLDRFEAVSPLIDGEGRRWLAAMRSDALYELGDLDGTRRQATLAGNRRQATFHGALAERLARCEHKTGRVLLRVPFVQQGQKTCTPATLAELAAFWGQPLDQSAVAEAICYDGTLRHRARSWAEENGWAVREFRVTWASARALLDRGIPFALATAGTMGGHHQAVVGYDTLRGSLFVRCPSQPFLKEVLAEPFLEAQRWSGPCGGVFLPQEKVHRLAGLDLPDAEAYDDLYAVDVALFEHRRYDAGVAQRRMAKTAPAHPLTLWAALRLAMYDSDQAAALKCIRALLRAFPGAAALEFWKLQNIRTLAPPRDYARALAQTCERHPRDVPLQSQLAYELSVNQRDHERARRVLGPVLRSGSGPAEAMNLVSLANTLRAEGRVDDALELTSLAAHLEDRHEGWALTYYVAVRDRGSTDEALAFLRRRFETHGRSSSDPAQTLFTALREASQTSEAFEVLGQALSLRPSDGSLALFAAEAHAARGESDRANELLSAARGRTHRASWLRTAASLASHRGDRTAALRWWRELLVVEPAAVDGHQAVVNLLADTGRGGEACTHLRSACERFPHHHSLQQLRAAWDRSTSRGGMAPARESLRAQPSSDDEEIDLNGAVAFLLASPLICLLLLLVTAL